VPGLEVAATTRSGEAIAQTDDGLTIKRAVAIASNRDGALVRVEAVPGEDIVVLQIADGPELRLHPETAADLMRAQQRADANARGGAADAVPGDVSVPMQLSWRTLEEGAATRGATRGFGGVILKAFKVLTGFGEDNAADFAVSKIVSKMDGQVDEGVYALNADVLHPLKGTRAVTSVPAAPAGAPTLVLIHGTFSSTHGTFSKLWSDQHQLVTTLFNFYGGRVYALDHRTLGATPIDNALTLAKAMPKNAKLHLLTHSRGGLVAETLARVCATPDDQFALFRGDERYAPHLKALTELAAVVKERNITVERMVRVACPVRGTLLASKRLDAYISVLKWALELARLPVAPELVGFLGAVAKRKADPAELPGLEVQMPDSKLVTWLHAIDAPIPGDLRVIAGDLQGDSVVSWLKTLLADGFYWTDNDLVVQTRSMYGGAPRAKTAQFVFDQGGGVSHFNYFRNDRTALAVVEGLTHDRPPSFNTIGPLSWAGQASEGVRGAFATEATDVSQRDKPLVFLIPGIIGSNLKIDDDRIWLGWRLVNGFKRLAYTGGRGNIAPDGPIGLTYDRLSDYLAETHAVVEFAYDWRLPIEDEAARLAKAVDAALNVREQNGLPVRIVAHSMGGLLARTMQLVDPDVWSRMMARDGGRLLMLGTPNAGSFAPMQVLSGDDNFGNMLSAAGAPFQGRAARQVMAEFPGLLQLQADLLGDRGLDREETWKQIADADIEWLRRNSIWHRLPLQLDDNRWGVPPQRVLDAAKALRTRLDRQLDEAPAIFGNKVMLVIGRAPATPDSFEKSESGEFVYLDLPEDGDGRVTRQRAMLPGVRTWKVNTDHGNLPRQRDAFDAYLQLLKTGSTTLLTEVAASSGASRAAAADAVARQRSRPSRTALESQPPQNPGDVLRIAKDPALFAAAAPRGAALRVTVVNGDLTFVGDPLMVGHYRSLQLTGTERVMNDLIGNTMQESLRIGRYPVAPGSNQLFDNVRAHPFRDLPRPKSVIVVGLGDEGSLRPEALIETVRHGVLAWAQRVSETPRAIPQLFNLATTLIGSGGAGMSPGESAQCIVQGVKEANELLEQQDASGQWPRVGHLRLIELYLDRATEAWQAVRVQASGAAALYALDDEIDEGHGGLRRTADAGYRGADYDFVSALTATDNGDTRIAYSIDTKRARTELRDESVQLRLVRSMVSAASNAGNRDPQIGRSLFKLLIPPAIKPFLGGSNAVVLELDGGSAGVPWELLDTPGAGPNALPWAIRSKLLRKLRVPDATSPTQDATADASVLVIGEPECDRRKYPPLFGAREEAAAVVGQLTTALRSRTGAVKALIRPENRREPGPDAHAVVNALLERNWRIVHIAGHGEPPEWVTKAGTRGVGDPRGVVLSNDIFLGPREMKKMTAVPELVFVNCCHLAARGSEETLEAQEQRRSQFAVGVAEALISIGVRCVIAAAWAVDDQAATTFATSFYRSLLSGARFMDAVSEARSAAYACGGNTWAAYQCYGDPDWVFTTGVGDAQAPRAAVGHEFAGIGSAPALKVTLYTIAVQAGKTVDRHDEYAEKLEFLEAHFGKRWGDRGEIAQGFGVAWNELGNRENALPYLERAVRAADGSATIQAVEQLCNVRARLAWDRVLAAHFARKHATGDDLATAQAALDQAIANGLEGLEEASRLLDQVTAYESTMERESLRASAYKRRAMIHRVQGDADAERKAIKEMQKFYQRALDAGRAAKRSDVFYPGLNLLAGIIAAKPKLPCRFDPAVVDDVRRSLERRSKEDPDFWSVSGERELELYLAVSQCQLATTRDLIARGYTSLYSRVSAPRKWDSIFDTAHFVLTRYAETNPEDAERKAAEALLDQLQSFTPYKHLGGAERDYVD
jgi:tetratricopeptide (TPR) repeat protein